MEACQELLNFSSPQCKELSFNSANQNSIKHIKPVKFGGGYCFVESALLESASRNRFLYWRISDSSLELQDVSFDFQLMEGSLKLIFQNAAIACEPGIYETDDNVIILVTTTSGIYRFHFPHPNILIKGKSQIVSSNSPLPSIFANASSSSILGPSNYYMFPNIPNMSQFSCASSLHLFDDSSLFSFSNQSGNVVLFKMAPPHSFSANVSIYEVKQVGVMSRLLGGIVTSVVGNTVEGGHACSDMSILQDANGETMVCAVTWDYRLKIWSANTCEILVNEDMFPEAASYIDRNKVISAGSKNMIRKYVGNINGEQVILLGVFLYIPNNVQFHVYQINSTGSSFSLQHVLVFYDTEEDLVDFTFDSEMFWAVWSHKNSNYVVKFEHMTKSNDSTWTEVMMTPKIEEELTPSPSIDPRQLYLNHIFHPHNFSKDAIARALSSYTHQFGNVNLKLKTLTKKELRSEVCLAVEEQIRLAAADVEFDVQESEFLDLQMQQWSTFYSFCCRNEERNRKIVGIIRDPSTRMVALIKDKCFSTMRSYGVLDQYYLDDNSPSLQSYQEFYPNIRFDENIHKRMNKLLKCLRLMSCPSDADVWEDHFGSPSFNPLALSQRHAHLLMVMQSREFDNSVNELGTFHVSIIKFVMELMDNFVDKINYHEDLYMEEDDGIGGNEEVLRKLFSSSEGLKALVEAVKQSNETKYHLAKDLLVLVVYLRNCTIQLSSSQIHEVEQLMNQLCQLVGSLHAILWCASTTVLATDVSCVEKTKKSLEHLNQFKHESNFNLLESEEHSMTLLELFLLVRGGEEMINKFSSFLKIHSSSKLWLNGLPCMADLVSMCLRPDLSGFTLPLTLFNCCQHLQLQHYVHMILKFYKYDVGTLKFFLGLSYLATNEAKKSLSCFKEVRQYVGAEEFLLQLVAEADPLYVETIYSMKIMSLLEEFEYPSLLADFARYTVEKSDDDDPNLSTIWMKIFKSELELRHYEAAYDALFKNPEASRQKDCLRLFLAVLCENKEYKTLVSLSYRSRGSLIENEVVSILESRARSSDVTKHNFYDLLYAFHIHRKNFRCAANIMYDCAMRWGHEVSGLDGLVRMVEYLTICHNCFLLVDQRDNWIVRPPVPSSHNRPVVSLKHSSDGTELKHKSGRSKMSKNCVEVLDVKAVEKELMISSSLLSVHNLSGEKKMIPVRAVAMKAEEVVGLLCNSGLYDKAFQLSNVFEIPLVPVFESLVLRCIGLCGKSAISEQVLMINLDNRHQLNWIDHNEDVTCALSNKYMTASDRAWRILQTSLEKFEKSSSTRGLRCCALKMFYNNFPLPSWFAAIYKKLNPAELMMLYSEHGRLQEASDLALQYIEAVDGKGKDHFDLKDYLHAGSPPVWLPYKVIDNILLSYDTLRDSSPILTKTISMLKEALAKHFKLVEHSSKAVVYSAN